jgi:hypothetical protein
VSVRPPWSYVQARLQARHGERLNESDWRVLEAARSLDHFIDRARATPLRRFAEPLNAGMNAHAIERVLRAGWRSYVAELASWSAVRWRPAILWLQAFPDLPAIDAILNGETPAWVEQDSLLRAFLDGNRAATFVKSPLEALMPGPAREPALVARWHAHWRGLLPATGEDRRALSALADAVKAHAERLALADPSDKSTSYHAALAQTAARMFRRHAGTPVVVFCHLMLVALDLARLRGGLVRRALFEPAKEAA